MKTYHGYRRMHLSHEGKPTTCECVVMVRTARDVADNRRGRPLRPRLDIRNHSPTGFEWGYGGSGPAQLALALVADACGRQMSTPPIYQRVKSLVAALPHDGWILTQEQIENAVKRAVEEAGL